MSPPEPLSSPSSGARFSEHLHEPADKALPRILPRDPGSVLDALAEAAAALAAAARALAQIIPAASQSPASPGPGPGPCMSSERHTDPGFSQTGPISRSPAFVLGPGQAGAPSLVEAINELLKAKARAGRSDGYLKILRSHLKRLAAAFPGRQVDDVTTPEIERWIDGLDFSGRHRAGHLESARLLFAFSLRRGYVTRNPAAAVELPQDAARLRPPVVHTPEEVARVLEAVRAAGELGLLRFLALRYFAGLRASEAQRLRPENIRQADGVIEVPAHVAKTRRRRLVVIEPALAAWLALGGELPVRDLNSRLARVGRLAGVPWSPGVTRHSFVSYHLAAFENAGRTALQAGHTEAMVFEHYRALVTKEAAAAFWALRPAPAEKTAS